MADFLTLSEAADRLNVHPTTLRRWADQGDILVMVTPGGHRRFPISEIDRLRSGKQEESDSDTIDALLHDVLNETRKELRESGANSWASSMTEDDRNRKRQSGMEMMNLLKEFLKSEDPKPEILDRAKVLGSKYGLDAQEANMSLSSVISATMFFRDRIIEGLSKNEERTIVLNSLRKTHSFLNTVLISATEEFERVDT